jgi:hypothetical protein
MNRYEVGDELIVVDCPFMMGVRGVVKSVLVGSPDVAYIIVADTGQVTVFHNEVVRVTAQRVTVQRTTGVVSA